MEARNKEEFLDPRNGWSRGKVVVTRNGRNIAAWIAEAQSVSAKGEQPACMVTDDEQEWHDVTAILYKAWGVDDLLYEVNRNASRHFHWSFFRRGHDWGNTRRELTGPDDTGDWVVHVLGPVM